MMTCCRLRSGRAIYPISPSSRNASLTSCNGGRRYSEYQYHHARSSTRLCVSSVETTRLTLDDISLDLDLIERDGVDVFDLVIAGAGPSGLSVGSRVAKSGYKVCIVDPYPLSLWPNNYGVWVDEFEAMGLDDCFQKVWSKADVFLDNNKPPKSLNRPYARVDRPKLKRKLLNACIENGTTPLSGPIDDLDGTIWLGVFFRQAKAEAVDTSASLNCVTCSEGRPLKARLFLDATGHSRRFIQYDQKFDPAFQGAYGYIATVESHPFDKDAMLFMDWRDDYAQDDPAFLRRISDLPTFLYAMPFSETEIFLEETSLVAKPIAPFDDLKERLERRLQHLGIKVLDKREEEYCVIPMGGVLPKKPQTVLGIGGTAGMVHPSTGYMISRMLGAAPGLADTIIDQLSHDTWNEKQAQAVSKVLWKGIWPVERVRQRDFYRFGMEVLLKLNLQETRDFFRAFFSLTEHDWQGFLSSRLSFVELVGFGWHLFLQADNPTRQTILKKGAPYLAFLISSIGSSLFQG